MLHFRLDTDTSGKIYLPLAAVLTHIVLKLRKASCEKKVDLNPKCQGFERLRNYDLPGYAKDRDEDGIFFPVREEVIPSGVTVDCRATLFLTMLCVYLEGTLWSNK